MTGAPQGGMEPGRGRAGARREGATSPYQMAGTAWAIPCSNPASLSQARLSCALHSFLLHAVGRVLRLPGPGLRSGVSVGWLALSAALLGGCAVYVPGQRVVTEGGVVVGSAPPPMVQETVTVQPSIGMVWIPGLWFWDGGNYRWRGGHWAHPPAGYSRWAPGAWHAAPGGHVWHAGGWRR